MVNFYSHGGMSVRPTLSYSLILGRVFRCRSLFNLVLVSLSLLFYSTSALAVIDISGTYSGTMTGTISCPGPISSPTSTTVTQTTTQSGSSFTGTGNGTVANSFGNFTVTYSYSGAISGNAYSGTVNGDVSGGITFTGTFSGTVSADGNTITQTLSNSFSNGCSETISGTLTRTKDGVLITPETPSSVLLAPALLNSQVKSITGNLNARIGDVLHGTARGPRKTASGFMWGGQSGLNAGDGMTSYGLWGSYAYSDFENDLSSTAFDGNRHNLLGGFDLSPWEKSVLGVAVGYESSDIDTGFNRGNQDTDGYTIAAYAGYLLNEPWSFDASIGYSNIDSDQFRTDPVTGARITSDPSAERWFGTLNFNGFKRWENWLIGGRIGLLYARNVQESFTESNGARISQFSSELGQWGIGGDVGYSLDKFEPFVKLNYEYDFQMTEFSSSVGSQPSNDSDNFLFGAGLRYFGTNGLTGNLEWNKRLGRDDFDEDTLTATLRMDF